MPKKHTQFVIIGLGLLGGSTAGAIRRHMRNAHVIGVSRSLANVRQAVKRRLIHEGTTNLAKAAADADFVIICTPVNTIQHLITQLDRFAKPGCIVTDVGSVKGFLTRWAEKKSWKRIHYIGSHPMAGSHLTGLQHSDSQLFGGALTFVTSHRKMSKFAFRKVMSFWSALKSRVVSLSGDRHDTVVGEISHLPHAVASILVHTVSNNALPFAASGFRDTTRIAASDPNIWVPILQSNRQAVRKSLVCFEKSLRAFLALLDKGHERKIYHYLKKSAARRQKLKY